MHSDHPRLTPADVRDFVDVVVRQGVSEDAVKGFFIRKGFPDVTPDEKKLAQLVDEIVRSCGSDSDRNTESVEAAFSARVFGLLDLFDDVALGDEGYWSYLAVRFFWKFVAIRQRSAWLAAVGEPRNPDQPDSERQKLERYLIGKDHYQIPLRMYLRAQSVRGPDEDFSLTEVPGTDFWRSQILGVRTSVYPSLARSVASEQKLKELNVEEQRPPGRMVNRLRANIEFTRHEEGEARALVEAIWVASSTESKSASSKPVKKPATSKKAAAPKKRAVSKEE